MNKYRTLAKKGIEVWKKVKGFPNYRVSNLGRVKSLLHGKIKKFLTPCKIGKTSEYRSVCLSHQGKSRTILVHTIVLNAFIGPCPEGKQCRHKDGNPANNRLDNIYWGTPLKNAIDREMHGRTAWGENAGGAKLDSDFVFAIFDLYDTGRYSTKILAKLFGVCRTTIGNILHQKTWRRLHANRKRELRNKRRIEWEPF